MATIGNEESEALQAEGLWAESVRRAFNEAHGKTSLLDALIPGYGPFAKLKVEQVTEIKQRLDRVNAIDSALAEIKAFRAGTV